VSTSITVRRYLNKQDVRYATTEFAGSIDEMFNKGNENINPTQIAKAIVLKDIRGMLMAVLPGPHVLDIEAINRQLHRNLREAGSEDYQSVFSDCSPGVLPPLGEAYGFETVIDDGLLDQDLVYFVSGNNNELVRISGYDFQLLHSNAWFGNTFSQISKEEKKPEITPRKKHTEDTDNLDIKSQLSNLDNPPKLPTMAQKIIQLDTNPYAHGEDLAKLVENDATLSEQIIRYAQTASYVKDPSIATLRQAMSRGFSYDLVMNIALAISTIRAFKITSHGPLGLQAFWRHATYSATLIHGLCTMLPRKAGVQTGKAILAGMIHNIGHLALGDLFPKEYSALSNALGDNTADTPVSDLEQRMFGISHGEIGHWLTELWNMPSDICTAIKHHHDTDYQGPYKEYAYLVYLADSLLAQHNIGDSTEDEITDEFLQRLGLTRQQVNIALEKTIKDRDELDNMARQLAA
jgi:HD-like signal output (HDOD) protein/prolyl-tRNA editing enzyme YbaK/EbsC (Cys-tRNA(Pro) deacylase)